jgi:NAD(P)-dependent dehydrogenase (short-subunit alcohol dehydrogenase family)
MTAGSALVTGAAVRLGRAMAVALAEDGRDVAIHYNGSEAEAEETAGAVRATGRRAVTLKADLLDEDAAAALVGRAAEALGPLDVLINNASIFENDHVADMTRESWDRAMGSNLRAPVQLSQAFAAQAPEAATDANGEPVARAVIVNMLDQRLLKPTPHFQSYTMAKAGLQMFTRTAAQALAPHVRVAAIGPGPTLRAARQSEAHFARQRAACMLGRGSDPEDIVTALRFILACKAFTGQMLAIDGGQHLAWKTADVAGTDH